MLLEMTMMYSAVLLTCPCQHATMVNFGERSGRIYKNARVGNMQDFTQDEPDTRIEQYYYCYTQASTIPPRVTQDTQVNTLGKCFMLVVVNGRHSGDPCGSFTCYTPRGCSVVDYVVMSADLYSSVVEFSIGELPLYSDHCPLHLVLNLSIMEKERQENKENTHVPAHCLMKPLGYTHTRLVRGTVESKSCNIKLIVPHLIGLQKPSKK